MPEELITEPQVRYWFNCIKRAKKAMPVARWRAASARLNAKKVEGDTGDEKPYVNGFRQHYEALKSFLDQTTADFKITPTSVFLQNEEVIKQAECDFVYLTYIWDEQKCQQLSSKKLDSAIVKNLGCTCIGFDKKKWMPFLKYIPAERVLLDPDCDGNRFNASWEGYIEPISLEELKSRHPDLTEEELTQIKKSSKSILTEEDKTEIETAEMQDGKLFNVVELVHIFARNDAAVRKFGVEQVNSDEPEALNKKDAELLRLSMPKKYLQLIDGYPKPLLEIDEWPYELDDNEFPTTPLSFNTPSDNTYGFTDYVQMERLDEAFDAIMYDIQKSAFREGTKKYAGRDSASSLSDVQINAFFDNKNEYYLKGFLDTEGKQKIEQIDTGKFSPELVNALKLVDEQRDKASALGELVSTEASQYKDVTALAAGIHDANIHQRINRRLGGPEGYELSIAEDAIKLLEIAHQFVPRQSLVKMPTPRMSIGADGVPYETDERYDNYTYMPWQQAVAAISDGAELIQLGVDAIVGEELAKYWRTTKEMSVKLMKLSTKIRVVPGSTRSITKERRAGVLKQFYIEIFQPIYEAMGRMDLAVNFVEYLGNLIGLSESKNLLPDLGEVQQFMKQQEQLKQQEAMQASLSGAMGK